MLNFLLESFWVGPWQNISNLLTGTLLPRYLTPKWDLAISRL